MAEEHNAEWEKKLRGIIADGDAKRTAKAVKQLEAAGAEVVIQFYHPAEPFGCFSNFSNHSFHLNGRRWPTSEHYFQAMKFEQSHADFMAVAKAPKPGDAARMGRDRSRPLRKDWEEVKDQIMYDACLAKFQQNPEICMTLLRTESATLVEHTFKDSYWGDGGDGTGKNMLGHVLMVVRRKIVEQKLAGAKNLHETPSDRPPQATPAVSGTAPEDTEETPPPPAKTDDTNEGVPPPPQAPPKKKHRLQH